MLGHPIGSEFHDRALPEAPLYLGNGRIKSL
jgi:hypothetical protein